MEAQAAADSRRYTNWSTTLTRKRCTGKALAERRRRAVQLHLAGFTQEEIADKLGMHPSVVSRDLQWIRDSSCPGESPDVQEACFIQMAKMKFDPQGSQFDPTNPPLEKTPLSPEEAAVLERKEDLRPAGRWIRPPTEVVISICKLTQINANLRK